MTPINIDKNPQTKNNILNKDILKMKKKKYNLTKKNVRTIFGNMLKNIVIIVGEPS